MLLKEDSKHHEDQQKYEEIQQFFFGFNWSTGEVVILSNCGMILWMVAKSCITLYG
jgi:hypothetical protein